MPEWQQEMVARVATLPAADRSLIFKWIACRHPSDPAQVPLQLSVVAAVPGRLNLERVGRSIDKTATRYADRFQGGSQTALDAAVHRAWTKARMRASRRGEANRQLVARATALTPDVVTAAGTDWQDLTGGAFDPIARRMGEWSDSTMQGLQDSALPDWHYVTGEDEEKLKEEKELRNNLLWLWLVMLLQFLLRNGLGGRIEQGTVQGQPPDTKVPPGLGRAAVDILTGQADPVVVPTDDPEGVPYVTLGPPAKEPWLQTLLSQVAGIPIETVYHWVRGEPQHPFPPHVPLDGIVTTDRWTDPQLAANPEEFPYVDHSFPGDHIWCQCEWLTEYRYREP